MSHSHPFRLSRRRLAAWYTGVMTLILIAGSYALYRLLIHARWLHLERDMQKLAIALERRIHPVLEQPGQFSPTIQQQLPGLCIGAQTCAVTLGPDRSLATLPTFLTDSVIQEKDKYCVRFLNPSGDPVASLNIPADNEACNGVKFWRRMRDRQGEHYHQKRYPLQTTTQADWGTLQIARSLNTLDWYLFWVEIVLLVLLLLSIALVGYASWWLAGMAMQPVEQAYHQMQQFTADAAHELRTPVAAIRAMVQTALRSADDLTPEEVNATLQTVERQSHRLSRLMQDLLVLSQMEQATGANTRKICDLSDLLKTLAEEFQDMAASSQVSLGLEFCATVPVHVLGYPEQLHRAVANLLSNGIQYTPAGGRVTLSLDSEATHEAIIQVRDTGVGIAPEAQARIFDRFYRVDKERSRHSGGSGLGLAIVQAIVLGHKGSIQVESELGKGSTFTIRLPMLVVL